MAIARTKTWLADATLPASELNDLEANIVDNQQQIGNPRTQSFDMDGQELILDLDGDTSITADTDDQVDVRIGGADVIKMTAAGLFVKGKPVSTSEDLRIVQMLMTRVSMLELAASQQEGNALLAAQVFDIS